MNTLLVGTDFSPRSDRALRRGLLLARQTGAELLLVAVIGDQDTTGSPAAREHEARQLLERMQQTITESDGVPCRIALRTGHPAQELAAVAQEEEASLMVIGPHRRSMLRDAFGAVTAERIARAAPVPLISASGMPAGPYRRILLPVDLQESSQRAVEALKALPFRGEAKIALVHFYDAQAREMLGRAGVPATRRAAYLADCAEAARYDLRTFAGAAGLEGAALLVSEAKGPMSDMIQQFAADDGTDLIVVSQSGKGAIGKSILGSVTEDLLRLGTCDTLVVPGA